MIPRITGHLAAWRCEYIGHRPRHHSIKMARLSMAIPMDEPARYPEGLQLYSWSCVLLHTIWSRRHNRENSVDWKNHSGVEMKANHKPLTTVPSGLASLERRPYRERCANPCDWESIKLAVELHSELQPSHCQPQRGSSRITLHDAETFRSTQRSPSL